MLIQGKKKKKNFTEIDMTNLYRLNEVLHRLITIKKQKQNKKKTITKKAKIYSKLHLHYNLNKI